LEAADSELLIGHEPDRLGYVVDHQLVAQVVVEVVDCLLLKGHVPGKLNYSYVVDRRLDSFGRSFGELADCLLMKRRHEWMESVVARLHYLAVEVALLSVVVLAGARHRHRYCWHVEMKVDVLGQQRELLPSLHQLLGRREKVGFLYFPLFDQGVSGDIVVWRLALLSP
jgi:hypothetical protein